MADISQHVLAGAEHITFGDPDFFNGPGHALPLVRQLHEEFPQITYNVTVKIEHLVKHAKHLPVLKETGCLFVTSAVESIDPKTLDHFDKRHTPEDFAFVVRTFREIGLDLSSTFVTFTPWTTLANYLALLETIQELDLIYNVAQFSPRSGCLSRPDHGCSNCRKSSSWSSRLTMTRSVIRGRIRVLA